MILRIEVLDKDAIVLLLRDTTDRGANELYSIKVSLSDLLALLLRVAANDLRAMVYVE